MKKIILLCFTLISINAFAQVKVGSNPTTIDPSTVLEVESTSKGVLFPRLTSSQRNAIISPAKGLVIYNTDEKCLQVNNGTSQGPSWECSFTSSSLNADLLRFSDRIPYKWANGVGYGTFNITTNQEVLVPSSSYSFTTQLNGTLTLTYNAFIDLIDIDRWQHIEYRLYIDNVLVGTQSFEQNPNDHASISITGHKSISTGNHIVELKAFGLYGSTSFGSHRVYSNSYFASIQ